MTSAPDSQHILERIRSLTFPDNLDPHLARHLPAILDGTKRPTSLTLALIAEHTGVSVDWLLYGEASEPTDGLTLQQQDALWDAVAVPGPQKPTFTEQHDRVCKTVAGILNELTAVRTSIDDDDDAVPT